MRDLETALPRAALDARDVGLSALRGAAAACRASAFPSKPGGQPFLAMVGAADAAIPSLQDKLGAAEKVRFGL